MFLCVCVYAGAVRVHGGSCVTQQVMDKPVWPAMQTVLVPLWLLMTEAVEQAAWAVLQCTVCSPGRYFGLSDLVKGMS